MDFMKVDRPVALGEPALEMERFGRRRDPEQPVETIETGAAGFEDEIGARVARGIAEETARGQRRRADGRLHPIDPESAFDP